MQKYIWIWKWKWRWWLSNESKQKKQNNKRKKRSFRCEVIDKSKSFEEQIKSLEKKEDLEEYWLMKDYHDKELKSKVIKIKFAQLSNIIDKKLFEPIFGHTLINIADKLINTTNKEENQIIVKKIEKSKDNLFEMDNFNDAIDLILDFNENELKDLV